MPEPQVLVVLLFVLAVPLLELRQSLAVSGQ